MTERRREYSDKDKAELLAEVARLDGNMTKAARVTGVPRRTLRVWWDALADEERVEYIEVAKARAEHYWQNIHDECLEVARDKIKDMSARDAIVGAGISFDKLQLLRGQATGIQGMLSADADALAKSVEEILGKVEVGKD